MQWQIGIRKFVHGPEFIPMLHRTKEARSSNGDPSWLGYPATRLLPTLSSVNSDPLIAYQGEFILAYHRYEVLVHLGRRDD